MTSVDLVQIQNTRVAVNIMKKFNNKTESGFSLIEVLITMVILAVGILAIAALQFRGMQYSDDAFMRSDLNILAYDILDRMRLNSSNIDDYTSNTPFTVPLTCASNVQCDPSTCNTTVVTAANDLICWRNQVFNKFPPGSTASITSLGNEYSVVFSWAGRDGATRTIDYTITNI
jgi:type IV pilus assembly protein PilV